MKRYSVGYIQYNNVNSTIFKTDSLSEARTLILRTNEHISRRFGKRSKLVIWDKHLNFQEE